MTFEPAPERGTGADPEEGLLAQPKDDEVDERGVAKRHRDTRLQTKLTSAALQKRLLSLYRDANLALEEQGVNILYLALGTLLWFEDDNSDVERYAPLVLIPAKLARKAATTKFSISWTEEELAENVSLGEKLRADFGIEMPQFPELMGADGAEVNEELRRYFGEVQVAIGTKARWKVIPDDITVGLFSFSKYLMYRDLDRASWENESIVLHPLLSGLLGDGFFGREPRAEKDDEATFLDDVLPVPKMTYVVEADSSQIVAIENARAGANLVIQGPPGTGKSQSIANLIAALVADGKRVLFIAEKLAALEVVKRRLDRTGLGGLALELHSNKTSKRAVLDDLQRTLNAPRIATANLGESFAQLERTREALTDYARAVHDAHAPSGTTAYHAYGRILALRGEGLADMNLSLPAAHTWTKADLQERLGLARAFGKKLQDIGPPSSHAWRGVGLLSALPSDLDAIAAEVTSAGAALDVARGELAELAQLVGVTVPQTLKDGRCFARFAEHVGQMPSPEQRTSLTSDAWKNVDDVAMLVRDGAAEANTLRELLLAHEDVISAIGADARATCASFQQLKDLTGFTEPLTADGCIRLNKRVEQVLRCPPCDTSALASPAWNDIAGLRANLDIFLRAHAAKKRTDPLVDEEHALALEAASVHAIIEEKGASLFRIFSGKYRAAVRQLKATLKTSQTLPKGREALLRLTADIAARQTARRLLPRASSQMAEAFGSLWSGEASNFQELTALMEWVAAGGTEPVRMVAARGLHKDSLRQLVAQLAQAPSIVQRYLAALTSLAVKAPPFADVALDAVANSFADAPAFIEAEHKKRERPRSIADRAALGEAAFGSLWQGQESDWEALGDIVTWVRRAIELAGPSAASIGGKCAAPSSIAGKERSLTSSLVAADSFVRTLLASLKTTDTTIFSAGLDQTPLQAVSEQLERWAHHRDGLRGYIDYLGYRNKAVSLGLKGLVDEVERGALRPEDTAAAVETTFYNLILRDLKKRHQALGLFDGRDHDERVLAFRKLDRERQEHAKRQVLDAHARALPVAQTIGPMAVLLGEFQKKRKHLAVRQLIAKAGSAVQAIKPVFMMSPLSVAQFLVPGRAKFDVVVMDEASQVRPVDALGAIARADQIVVVGDDKQMPPTSFFSRLTSNDAEEPQREDEEDVLTVSDVESILGLCQAKGLPSRMLRWHYRSRHQSLIAVSNVEYYGGKLFVVPSPTIGGAQRGKEQGATAHADPGLFFHHLPHAMYDRGASATNPIEARTIAEAVMEHARSRPDVTLGVATFSTAQQQAILDELERLRREDPSTEPFFGSDHSEPFFVKNLENVQGDERDVIFISVCYGRDKSGYFTMNFGPLGHPGGERRLNVLISRARLRCEVFSPVTAGDIDLERAKGKGIKGLKSFLEYAATGRLGIAEETGADHDSPFEAAVASELKKSGFEVHAQIGQSGFFIDLAIVDPDQPGRYVLGIECDGRAYHSSRSARDRDRLRQAVLEDHGWTIHRIWSTDWFHKPQAELAKVREAYAKAKAAPSETTFGSRRSKPPTTAGVEPAAASAPLAPAREQPPRLPAPRATPYEQASFEVPREKDIPDTSHPILARVIQNVVVVEGPIHDAELVTRMRELWGVKRAGSSIQDAVAKSAALAIRMNTIVVVDGSFFDVPGRVARVRDRSAVTSASLRKPEMLAPSELRAALKRVLEENLGATREELKLAVAQLLGFKNAGARFKEVVDGTMSSMVRAGELEERGDYMSLKTPDR